jgi:NitT/TauT family transport system substrate-binding protein
MTERVSIQLKWLHQAQFAGYYVAADAGYYAEAGLDVDIRVGGPGVDPEAVVANGEADFAQGGGLESVLAARANGLPVVAIAALFQKVDVVYLARRGSDIRSLEDFAGRRVSTWYTGVHLILRALLRRAGVDLASIEEVVQAASMQPFIDGEVAVAAATFYNQLPKLRSAGIDDLVTFDPAEFGVVIPRDPIVASDQTLAERPDVVGRFLTASLRGWLKAFEQQDAAVAAVLRRSPTLDAGHQAIMIREVAALAHLGHGETMGIGYIDPTLVREAERFLFEHGQLPRSVPPEEASTMAFWRDVRTIGSHP